MANSKSWKEEAWERFLKKHWDNRPKGVDMVEYTKADLEPILSKYTKSGQGEIRIFHSGSKKVRAVQKRGIVKIPLTRKSWRIIKSPPNIDFKEPQRGGVFKAKNKLTDGMLAGIKETMALSVNPGETTLLAIANHAGIIADFYNLNEVGVLFTGGRQKAGVHLIVGTQDIDMTKAQIEIDGGFEWPETVVIAEMKSSFKQENFDVNQALFPMLKWENLLKNKKIYSLVLLAETNKGGIAYWAYDFIHDNSESSIGMKIGKSKKYILEIV
ncbi:MAG: hypothetical protein A3A97_02835 [Candidatus Terrybacteria bacterium RIFCSPLOWO2_01_FULL_40_23]|uniref:DUF6997 domain-containing protein n=1 Tax=Candidatus Terrybacteria bacterium RIFCSPLOWO2_01_FULL_40_23 TaxID=1802366 RepID=A0A1G2PSA6_9BACT|nr:MAG: hypothetical protein A3A97_02835 [Candidatus Terrybacteria bacterium RIFCSPLOWO2_01_FULL_40_23]